MKAQPAARLLLFYAACLAAMLVAAVTIAAMRNAPPAEAGTEPPAIEQPIRAVAR